jgi:hypothetical protein
VLKKALFSVFILPATHFEQILNTKRTKTLAKIDDILQKIARFYQLVQNPTVVHRMPHNLAILNNLFCPIL